MFRRDCGDDGRECGEELARQILPPLIGIGSGAGCDGQILVTTDLLGYNLGKAPSFVKTYANLNQVISKALSNMSGSKEGGIP